MQQPVDQNNIKGSPANTAASVADWQQTVETLVKSAKYGSVQIVIQDGKVVQIDSTEKIRLDQPQTKGGFGKKWTSSSEKQSVMPIWNPDQYLKFKNERTQPSLDLISRINLENPATILDLGCGPGNSTAALRRRWPEAKVTGLDNSPEMIAAALKDFPKGEWILGDVATFQPAAQSDLIFANATLQWLHHHETLVPRLFSFVKHGGALAVQVPANGDSPLAKAVFAVAAGPAWSKLTAGCEQLHNYRTPEYYFDIIRRLGSHFEIWQTTYYHILASQQGLIEWYRGTGMKPFLDRLPNDAARREFEAEVLKEISSFYPAQSDGRVLFPFRRNFFTVYK